MASALQGGNIEVRLDSLSGPVIATLPVPHTGGWEEWRTINANVNVNANLNLNANLNKHDIYLLFTGNKGAKLFNFDWWEMKR